MDLNKLRTLSLLAALALSAGLPVWADFETGLAAYDRGDFVAAAEAWLPLAEAGDPRAQYRMGALLASGDGVDQNLIQSLEYYRAAAEQGLPQAQNALAFVYRVGNGVSASYEKAFKWYLLAAEAGIGDAQFNVGSLYAGGRGTERDLVEGYKWLSLATAFGIEQARPALFYCADQMSPEQIEESRRRANAWRPRE